MSLSAHGITVDLPRGWEGRIYQRPGAEPTLHAANFRLPERDGDFASGATASMPPAGVLIVLKEYSPDSRLVPGAGLFASRTLPLPLATARFHPRCLQVGRPGQAGFQHFFTADQRPFCLYAVVNGLSAEPGVATAARDQLGQLNQILSSLDLAPGR